ncbi:hypothetical protein IJ670_01150 [bacterium]|nr:hypothetical protein [bacterium]
MKNEDLMLKISSFILALSFMQASAFASHMPVSIQGVQYYNNSNATSEKSKKILDEMNTLEQTKKGRGDILKELQNAQTNLIEKVAPNVKTREEMVFPVLKYAGPEMMPIEQPINPIISLYACPERF